jgi:glycosyltransferase 2 family protein
MNPHEILKSFKPSKALWPVLLGLGVAVYLVYRSFDIDAFRGIDWSLNLAFWVAMAFLMAILRHVAYMYRIRVLSGNQVGWYSSFVVISLWEFASAITPSLVGGTAFALLLLTKEGISPGRTTAIVMVTAFLDELFFIIFVPLLFLITGTNNVFTAINGQVVEAMTYGKSIFYFFWFGYVVLLIYTLALAYGLFVRPRALKWLIIKIFSLPLLRKWRTQAQLAGNDVMIASAELRMQKSGFWIKAFGATFISWTARYLVINCIIIAFSGNFHPVDHFLIYTRQLVMFVIMLVTPTPGGSGIAEVVFDIFLQDFSPEGLTASLGILWRIISYYPYLFLGLILLPRWIRNKFGHSHALTNKK